jgi:hypothetical protein
MGQFAALTGLSVPTLYAERARGRLKTIKVAGRRLVTREQGEAYLAAADRDPPAELAADAPADVRNPAAESPLSPLVAQPPPSPPRERGPPAPEKPQPRRQPKPRAVEVP